MPIGADIPSAPNPPENAMQEGRASLEAMKLYGKNLAIFERLGDQEGMGRCYSNIGGVAYARGNCDEAM